MSASPFCCLFVGNSLKGLELMASFAALFNFPLVVCDPEIKKLCDSFYPELLCTSIDTASFTTSISEQYEVAFTNLYPLEAKNFFAFSKNFTSKSLICFFLCDEELFPKEEKMLHGNVPILYESTNLLSKTLQTYKSEAIGNRIAIGNPKKEYFEKNKKQQHLLIHKYLSKLRSESKKLLHVYSELSDKNHLQKIASSLSKNTLLLVQVDPDSLSKETLRDIETLKKIGNIIVINIPLSYALFDYADAYLLNANYRAVPSLFFEKPTFFFEKEDKDFSYLKKLGPLLDSSKNTHIEAWIENFYAYDAQDRVALRKELQGLGFEKEVDKAFVKKQIEQTISGLKDQEYPF